MQHTLQSPHFQANPSLYSFLPLFYMAWADAVLTPGEVEKLPRSSEFAIPKLYRGIFNPANPPPSS